MGTDLGPALEEGSGVITANHGLSLENTPGVLCQHRAKSAKDGKRTGSGSMTIEMTTAHGTSTNNAHLLLGTIAVKETGGRMTNETIGARRKGARAINAKMNGAAQDHLGVFLHAIGTGRPHKTGEGQCPVTVHDGIPGN